MAEYTATVIESRHVRMQYTVEADSIEEAREKLEGGETEEEVELKFVSVVGRDIEDGPTKVSE